MSTHPFDRFKYKDVPAYLDAEVAHYNLEKADEQSRYARIAASVDAAMAEESRVIHIRFAEGWDADEGGWSDIIMHEVIHYISAQQSPAQKQALTARFLAACPAQIATGFYQLLEEPLAVAFGRTRPVLGFDVKAERIASLRAGKDATREVAAAELAEARQLTFSDRPEDLARQQFPCV